MRSSALFAVAFLMVTASSHAAIVITEVMSSGLSTNQDWFELTNTGPASVNLAGYEWEDSPAGGTDTAIFPSVDIAVNESIIVSEDDAVNEATFRTTWGIPASVQIVSQDDMDILSSNTFSGLSGTNGDQVHLYPNATDPAIASVTFPIATAGFTFEWNTSGVSLGLSVNGENGAHGTTPANDIGSPGTAVPEPASLGLLGAALVLLNRRRNAR